MSYQRRRSFNGETRQVSHKLLPKSIHQRHQTLSSNEDGGSKRTRDERATPALAACSVLSVDRYAGLHGSMQHLAVVACTQVHGDIWVFTNPSSSLTTPKLVSTLNITTHHACLHAGMPKELFHFRMKCGHSLCRSASSASLLS